MYQRLIIEDIITNRERHMEIARDFEEDNLSYFDSFTIIDYDFSSFDGFQVDIVESEDLKDLAQTISEDHEITVTLKQIDLDDYFYAYYEYLKGELEWHDIREGHGRLEKVNDPYYDTVINSLVRKR